FLCGDDDVHMATGESWVFDTWRSHNVLNPTERERVHLVVDTVGSAELWQLLSSPQGSGQSADARVPGGSPPLQFERMNAPVVMSPWELDALWADWLADACEATPDASAPLAVNARLQPLLRAWRAQWALHGE